MERMLVHPELGKRIISREGEVVCVYDASTADHVMQLSESVFRTELTAKAFESFQLHYHADLGYKPA